MISRFNFLLILASFYTLPESQIYHSAGPGASGGWTIIAIHDSMKSWERFREEVLGPAMAKGITVGFTSSPQELTFEVDTHLT
ncbi:MAG: hypothetical protein HY200_09560 [Nitrospirae bacterium]|nr:hypothetical protein [Nitrospirota bacterium]MBI3595190.1 hypothetical protein [Nitrospirota bacterium]